MIRTPYLGLRPPTPGVMSDPRVEDGVGDDVEILGHDLRLVLETDEAVDTLLRLRKNRTADAASTTEAARARVLAASDGEALCTLLGIIAHDQSLSDEESVPKGVAVIPTTVPQVFRAVTAQPGLVQQDEERSISAPIGYQVGTDAVLFDGTGDLLVHRTRMSHLAMVDDGGLVFGTYARSWDNTRTWDRVRFTTSPKDPGEVLDLYFPLFFPPEFASWNNGAGPSVWFRYAAPADCSVVASIGGLGSVTMGSTGGSRTLAQMSYDDVLFHTPTAGGFSWLQLRLGTSGAGGAVIDVETTIGYRFQQLRSI